MLNIIIIFILNMSSYLILYIFYLIKSNILIHLYLSLSFNLTYQLHKMKYYLKFELYLYILKFLKCFNFNKNKNYIFMTSLV